MTSMNYTQAIRMELKHRRIQIKCQFLMLSKMSRYCLRRQLIWSGMADLTFSCCDENQIREWKNQASKWFRFESFLTKFSCKIILQFMKWHPQIESSLLIQELPDFIEKFFPTETNNSCQCYFISIYFYFEGHIRGIFLYRSCYLPTSMQ